MVRVSLLAVVALAGCGFEATNGGATGDDTGSGQSADASTDGVNVAGDAADYGCYGTGLVRV